MVVLTSRRQALHGAGALAATLGLGIGRKSLPQVGSVSAEDNEPLAVAMLDVHAERLQPLLDAYVEATEVEIELTSLDYGELYGQLNLALTQRSDTFDVVSIEDPWVPQFASFLTPVEAEDLDPAQTVELANSLGRYPDDAPPCGFAWLGDAQFFVVRTDWLDVEGLSPPNTWDETTATAQAISAGMSAEDGTAAYAISTLTPHQIVDSYLPILRGCGRDLLDPKTGVPQLDTPEAQEAIGFFLQLAELSPEESTATGAPNNMERFAGGSVAMMSNFWSSAVLSTSSIEPARMSGPIACEAQPAQMGIEHQTLSGIWYAAVPVGSLQPGRARAFIDWLTAPDTQRAMVNLALPPIHAPVYGDSALIDAHPHLPRLLDLLAGATPRSRSPYYLQLEMLLATELAAMLDGAQSGEDALRNANIAMREFLEREGVLET